MSVKLVPEDIRERLDGVVRTTDIRVDPDSHHYIVLSQLYKWMRERAFPAVHGTMLDYGCGGQTYRQLFAPKIEKYIGADVAAAAETKLDIQLQPHQPVPVPDESVDTVLATQTLEHVPDPWFYLGECYRVLRPGGVLVLTAPMQWRHHEVPYDYFRFTKYGLIELLTRKGFEITRIDPTGGVYSLIGQIFLDHLGERGIRQKFLFRCLNRLALWLDRKVPDEGTTVNWMCIAHKPARILHAPRAEA